MRLAWYVLRVYSVDSIVARRGKPLGGQFGRRRCEFDDGSHHRREQGPGLSHSSAPDSGRARCLADGSRPGFGPAGSQRTQRPIRATQCHRRDLGRGRRPGRGRQRAKAHPRWRANSADPGFTATDLNQFRGTQTVEQGTDAIVRLATAGPDGRVLRPRWERPLVTLQVAGV